MKNAIELAIKGGWDKRRALFNPNDATYSMEKMYIDPLFWKALGKGLEWKEHGWEVEDGPDTNGSYRRPYLHYWHKFIDHLASGGNVDEFFNKLIK